MGSFCHPKSHACEDFVMRHKYIANRLNVNETNVKLAVSDLKRCGIIKKVNGSWVQVPESLLVNNTMANAVTSDFVRSYLRLALAAMDYGRFDDAICE